MQYRQTFSLVLFTHERGSTPVRKLAGGIEPSPLCTQYRTKHLHYKHIPGRRTKLKDAGIRLTELKLKTHSLTKMPEGKQKRNTLSPKRKQFKNTPCTHHTSIHTQSKGPCTPMQPTKATKRITKKGPQYNKLRRT